LPERELAEALGATIDPTPIAHHDQVLTHRRLRISVVRGSLAARDGDSLVVADDPSYDAIIRVTIAGAHTLGIAAATAAILHQYKDTPWISIPKLSRSSKKAT